MLVIVHPRLVSGVLGLQYIPGLESISIFYDLVLFTPRFLQFCVVGSLFSLCTQSSGIIPFFSPSSYPRRHFSHIGPFPTAVQLSHALFGSWVHCTTNVQPLVYGIHVNGVFEGDGRSTYIRVPRQILP